jgi:hypothetical protein
MDMSTARPADTPLPKGRPVSRKPSFANLRSAKPAPVPAAPPPTPVEASSISANTSKSAAPARPESRVGRKQIAGFFTPEMSFAMHMLARRQGRSLQTLMAEAFNDVLRKHGESPIGE